MLRRLLDSLKRTFPGFFGMIFRVRDMLLINFPTRLQMLRMRRTTSNNIQVFYLTTHFPKRPATRSEHAHGGSVKLTYLAENFPHHFPSANLAYIVTTIGHPLHNEILNTIKQTGLKFIVNHDGVAFPAWAGNQYIKFNKISKRILDHANFIVYQSRFSKLSANLYLSPPDVQNEIVYNPVDAHHFSPQDVKKPMELTLLLGGNQYEKYRLELALQTLHSLLKVIPTARLIVTGTLWLPEQEAWTWTNAALKEMNLTDHVEFVGKYTQAEAPRLYSKAHLLIHTKYADPCPGLIPEVMSCGLPVVHIGNGGVPELVEGAGIGLPVEHSWERYDLPEPEAMAHAVLQVYENLNHYSQAAREQAQKFALEKFVAKHREIFAKVLAS
ncbi:MAG: glycosyltransferase [Chloroflexi bacterium]|nr:glycosyltransferase [Chloroflexota bacterium]